MSYLYLWLWEQQTVAPTISERLRESRKNLLDLGLRNSLLNFRLSKRRGIEVVKEKSKEIYSLLVTQGKSMSFKEVPSESDLLPVAPDTGRKLKDPLTDSWLQTSLTSDALQRRLLATYLDSKSFIEERGANILYLALGMLKWYEEDSSSKELSAPLLLIPVTLDRTSAREKFTLKYNEEDIEENLSERASCSGPACSRGRWAD